jgi:hypothetical protein
MDEFTGIADHHSAIRLAIDRQRDAAIFSTGKSPKSCPALVRKIFREQPPRRRGAHLPIERKGADPGMTARVLSALTHVENRT